MFSGNCSNYSRSTSLRNLEICWPKWRLWAKGLWQQLGLWLLHTWPKGSWCNPWGCPQICWELWSFHWVYHTHESGWWNRIWTWVIFNSSATWWLPTLFYSKSGAYFFNDICRKLLWFSKSAVSSELHSYIIKVSKASIVEDQIRFQYDLELLLVAWFFLCRVQKISNIIDECVMLVSK